MAKRLEHLKIDAENKVVKVIGGAKVLNEEEKAQLAILLAADYTPEFVKREATTKQKARTAQAKGKNKDYYIGENGVITDDAEKAIFAELCKKENAYGVNGSFMTAKKWLAHKDEIAQAECKKDWAKLTEEEQAKVIVALDGVKFVKGVAVPK